MALYVPSLTDNFTPITSKRKRPHPPPLAAAESQKLPPHQLAQPNKPYAIPPQRFVLPSNRPPKPNKWPPKALLKTGPNLPRSSFYTTNKGRPSTSRPPKAARPTSSAPSKNVSKTTSKPLLPPTPPATSSWAKPLYPRGKPATLPTAPSVAHEQPKPTKPQIGSPSPAEKLKALALYLANVDLDEVCILAAKLRKTSDPSECFTILRNTRPF
ncbi:uncharacterized protein [Battus philenor]|uniref:uncharacterized protein n=1 Tax=Battus philenor TaxID=42288 RepID=UPI0035CF90C1